MEVLELTVQTISASLGKENHFIATFIATSLIDPRLLVHVVGELIVAAQGD